MKNFDCKFISETEKREIVVADQVYSEVLKQISTKNCILQY